MKLQTALSLLALANIPIVQAAPITSIDFETLTDSEIVTTQFSGLSFSNTRALSSGFSLNDLDFPPHSGSTVVSDDGSAIAIDFLTPVTSFSAFFTYAIPITLTAFDGIGGVLGSLNSALSTNVGVAPNEFIQLSGLGLINQIKISGDPAGFSFTMDDVAFDSASVPEPNTLALLTIALAGIKARRGKIKIVV